MLGAKKNNDYLLKMVEFWEDKTDALLNDIEFENLNIEFLTHPDFQGKSVTSDSERNTMLLNSLSTIQYRNIINSRYISYDFLLHYFKIFSGEEKTLLLEINKALNK